VGCADFLPAGYSPHLLLDHENGDSKVLRNSVNLYLTVRRHMAEHNKLHCIYGESTYVVTGVLLPGSTDLM
jgi:hypothetical protein